MLENLAILLAHQPADAPFGSEYIFVCFDDLRTVYYDLGKLHAIRDHQLKESH